MEKTLTNYISKCRHVFKEHGARINEMVRLREGEKYRFQRIGSKYEDAIRESEKSVEFNNVVKIIKNEVLSSDIERLWEKKVTNRKKNKAKKQASYVVTQEEKDKSSLNTACRATQCFFRNTGTYYNLWDNNEIDIDYLINTLKRYTDEQYQYIRLLVFDGVALYDKPNSPKNNFLTNVSLPIGDLSIYSENDLEKLLGFPHNIWEGHIKSPEVINKASQFHILTVKHTENFRGEIGLSFGDKFFPVNTYSAPNRTDDIEILGPIFLCIGSDSNLAQEINVRTNPFDMFPVSVSSRNDFLPDSYDDEGNPIPRRYVKYVGVKGEKLNKYFEIWNHVNSIDNKGFLRYPTEAFVRSIMNINKAEDNIMENFISLMTVLESVLNPESSTELAYKTSVRGACLLSDDPQKRYIFFKTISSLYKTRSQIVHKGHPGQAESKLKEVLSFRLIPLVKEIFSRYISLLFFVNQNFLPDLILPESMNLTSANKRPETISSIYNALIFDPSLTKQLEEKMGDYVISDDWLRQTDLRFHFEQRTNPKEAL